jgi:hypothetical protein
MPKIISSQEAKKLFLSDDFPQKGYFVIEMKKRPYAQVLELKDHINKIKNNREKPDSHKEPDQMNNFSQRIKNRLKELIS